MKAYATKTRKSRASVDGYIITARFGRHHIKMIEVMDCMFGGTQMEILPQLLMLKTLRKLLFAGIRTGRKLAALIKNMPDSSSQLRISKNEVPTT